MSCIKNILLTSDIIQRLEPPELVLCERLQVLFLFVQNLMFYYINQMKWSHYMILFDKMFDRYLLCMMTVRTKSWWRLSKWWIDRDLYGQGNRDRNRKHWNNVLSDMYTPYVNDAGMLLHMKRKESSQWDKSSLFLWFLAHLAIGHVSFCHG